MSPRSLKYEIKCIERTIEVAEANGEDATYERELVKEYKRYLPGGDKAHLWYKPGELQPE